MVSFPNAKQHGEMVCKLCACPPRVLLQYTPTLHVCTHRHIAPDENTISQWKALNHSVCIQVHIILCANGHSMHAGILYTHTL